MREQLGLRLDAPRGPVDILVIDSRGAADARLGVDIVSVLRTFSFEVVATRRSHAKLRRETSDRQRQTLTIPLHKELAPETLLAIYRQTLRYVQESALRRWFFIR